MADNTLSIEIKDKGPPAPGPAVPPALPPAQPMPRPSFDPIIEAQKQIEREKQRLQVLAAKQNLTQGPADVIDPHAGAAGPGQGALLKQIGNMLGGVTGKGLNLVGMLGGGGGAAAGGGAAGGAGGAGAAGGGAAAAAGGGGMLGGAAGGALAALGPVGAIVGAVIYVVDKVKEKMLDGVNAMGDFATSVAKLDAGGLADLNESIMKAVLPFGELFATASKQVRAFANALDMTAQHLSQYSGPLAVAEANADVRQILGDLRRSQELSPVLTPFVEARSRLSEAGQDLMVTLLKPLVPIATQFIEFTTRFLQGLDTLIKVGIDTTIEGINRMIDALNKIIVFFTNVNNQINRIERRVNQADPVEAPFVNEIRNLFSPIEAMRQERERIDNLRRDRSPRLNIPAAGVP